MGKIILVGPSGSGKDYIRTIFQKRGYKFAIPNTTRPKRDMEIVGEDYNFITGKSFKHLITSDKIFNYKVFNEWYYGITKSQWENCNLFIMSPGAIEQLSTNDRKQCMIIYLKTPKEVRVERLITRKNLDNDKGDSILRRIAADDIDFENFFDFDIIITNEQF